jgi:outer membrane protein assembly factor BamB
MFISKDKIYISTKDGEIIVFDTKLNKLYSKKFKFARLNSIFVDDKNIYIYEYNEYLIRTSLNLEKSEIFPLSDKFDGEIIKKDNKLFTKDKFIILE